MKKINKLFAILVLSTLFIGGLSLLGYMSAFLIGGAKAEMICEFIQKRFYPYMIQCTSIGIGCGMIAMYLSGDTALSIKNKKKG